MTAAMSPLDFPCCTGHSLHSERGAGHEACNSALLSERRSCCLRPSSFPRPGSVVASSRCQGCRALGERLCFAAEDGARDLHAGNDLRRPPTSSLWRRGGTHPAHLVRGDDVCGAGRPRPHSLPLTDADSGFRLCGLRARRGRSLRIQRDVRQSRQRRGEAGGGGLPRCCRRSWLAPEAGLRFVSRTPTCSSAGASASRLETRG